MTTPSSTLSLRSSSLLPRLTAGWKRTIFCYGNNHDRVVVVAVDRLMRRNADMEKVFTFDLLPNVGVTMTIASVHALK
jgi:hypothetical protein